MGNPAVFLDRDGVLNATVERNGGAASPRSLEELRLEPGAADAVARLRAAGFRVFIITNQPDIARGRVARAVAEAILDAVVQAVGPDDAALCPHDDADDCFCRKPRPGMIRELATRWDVDVHASYVVGDRDVDVAAGRAAGCRTVLLRRPYNGGAADDVVDTLEEAVTVIASRMNGSS